MTRSILLCIPVGCCAILAACGSGGSKTVVSTVTNPAPTTSQPSTTVTVTKTTPQPPLASAVVHLAFFRSPTGNIGCAIAEGTARCDIRNRDWSPAPRPAGCSRETGYGQGLIVEATRRAHFVCAGDTALNPNGPVLAYGRDSRVDDFTCKSRVDGVTCTNRSSGHGFFINRVRYRIF